MVLFVLLSLSIIIEFLKTILGIYLFLALFDLFVRFKSFIKIFELSLMRLIVVLLITTSLIFKVIWYKLLNRLTLMTLAGVSKIILFFSSLSFKLEIRILGLIPSHLILIESILVLIL